MLTLGLPTQDDWLDLDDDVRFYVRPCNTLVQAAARNSAQVRLEDLQKEIEAVRAEGGEVVGLPDLSDPHVYEAQQQVFYIQGLARFGVIKWEGIGDLEGNPLEFSHERSDLLMLEHPKIANKFAVRYQEAVTQVDREGND